MKLTADEFWKSKAALSRLAGQQVWKVGAAVFMREMLTFQCPRCQLSSPPADLTITIWHSTIVKESTWICPEHGKWSFWTSRPASMPIQMRQVVLTIHDALPAVCALQLWYRTCTAPESNGAINEVRFNFPAEGPGEHDVLDA